MPRKGEKYRPFPDYIAETERMVTMRDAGEKWDYIAAVFKLEESTVRGRVQRWRRKHAAP